MAELPRLSAISFARPRTEMSFPSGGWWLGSRRHWRLVCHALMVGQQRVEHTPARSCCFSIESRLSAGSLTALEPSRLLVPAHVAPRELVLMLLDEDRAGGGGKRQG